jgi:biotin carboxyl carrier protein
VKVEELRQIVRWLEDARIGVFEIEDDDRRVRIVPGNPASITIDDSEDRSGVIIAAEVPGIFRPIVPAGKPVRAGKIAALVQIGLIYAPVIASTDGTLARILTEPHTLVGFGTPLLEIAYQ